MDIKVIDNFLSKSYHKKLFEILTSADFPWYFINNITQKDSSDLREFGFNHTFWDTDGQRENFYSWFWKPALYQMMDVIGCDFILRSRCDITTHTDKNFLHRPHIDFDFPHYSTIFYINDCDGDTVFYDKKTINTEEIQFLDLNVVEKVTPKENRLIIFDGDIIHTGSSPSKNKKRILINSNFLKPENFFLNGDS